MVSFVGVSGGTSETTLLTLSVPSEASPGDLMLAFVSQQNTASITPPSGWELIVLATDSAQESYAWSRTLTGDEGSWDWTRSANGKFTGHLLVYRDAEIIGSATLDSPGSANSWTMPPLAYSGTNPWRVDMLGQRSSTPATSWTTPEGMTVRGARFTTGGGSTYSVVADSGAALSAPSPLTGLTYSNNGSATSAAAFISLALGEADEPASTTLNYWDGVSETPLTLTEWDGTTESPLSLKIA